MREKLLEVLKLTRNNALSVEEIYNKIYHTKIEEKNIEILKDTIKELIKEKQIYCTNSKKELYTLNPFREGVFHFRKNGSAYVLCDKDYINIDKNKTFGCLEGDIVLVRITDNNTMDGSIKELIKRKGIIGEVKTLKKQRYVVVGDDRYKVSIDDKIVDGMLVGIIIDKEKTDKYYHATIDRIIGHKNQPKLDERKLFYEFEINDEFPKEIDEELKNMPSSIKDEDLSGRRDLREEIIFTIDGDDTKDIDDAISIKILPNGNYLLGVHIADVSNYIKEGSYLDNEARERGNSVYTPGVVNPMYPPQLSNGICSLNPEVDRLAITCSMEIDKTGKTVDFDIYKSVIRSNIQMTYKNVNKILDENEIPDGYEKFASKLKEMKSLADILEKMRYNRGALDFDSSEIKIEVDDNGKPKNIGLRYQGTGENLIEVFMLQANETVATYLYNMGINSIYRVHDYPNIEKLQHTITVINNYGEKIIEKLNMKDPRFLQELLKNLKDSENFDIYSSMILRSMAKAFYDVNNTGHYGIGVDSKKREAYTHFTSPIRRYSDTIIHRILSAVLNGNIEKIQQEKYKENLIYIAKHCSQTEVIADKVEREADKMKMAEYMWDYINQDFSGKIVSFTNSGMYVRLDNNVEGRIGYKDMDDYYSYNEELEILVGERTRKVYRLGDRIDIRVVKANKDIREIDFIPVPKKKERSRTKNNNKNINNKL